MSEYIPNRKLKSVTVKNFQAHTNSTFNLENGLNLIVGTSDSGKSALARAINFVLYNISESDFVREKEKYFEVEIVFADDAIIKRTKGKDINSVSYKYPHDFDFTTYKAFGNNYPDEVLDFLDRPVITKSLGAVSYSDQSNKNFLIEQPASAQPKIISSIIGTDDLQKAADNCSTKVRSYNEQVKASENLIKTLEDKIETEYVDLDNKKESLDDLLLVIDQISSLETEVLLIDSDIKSYQSINKRGKDAKKNLTLHEKIVDQLSSKVETLVEKSNELKGLSEIIESNDSLTNKLESAKKKLRFHTLITESCIDSNIKTIETLKSDMHEISLLIYEKDLNHHRIYELQEKIKQEKTLIKNNESSLENYQKIIIDNGWYCSECNKFGGQEI